MFLCLQYLRISSNVGKSQHQFEKTYTQVPNLDQHGPIFYGLQFSKTSLKPPAMVLGCVWPFLGVLKGDFSETKKKSLSISISGPAIVGIEMYRI